MKITDITAQKHNKDRVSVFVDNEYSFSLDGVDAIKYQLKIDSEITLENIEFYRRECNIGKARAISMDILSRKPLCRKMLTDKLKEKGYDLDVIDEVANELVSIGILDDYSYAVLFAEYAKEKCWGERRFKYELSQKGVENKIINLVADEFDFCDADEILELLKQKYKGQDFNNIKVKQKVSRFLAARGFDFSVINEAINNMRGEQ